MLKNIILFIGLIFMIFSCQKDKEQSSNVELGLAKVVVEDSGFKDSEGKIFFPWGFNYTNPVDVGLIEDNWMDEDIWHTIQDDFLEMKNMGANVIRIHLQYNKFMLDASSPNETAFNRLLELVEFAEKNKLYLDITGLSAYRKIDQPSFYNNTTDAERWNTQALFWQTLADKVGSNPAVFAYNLMNEPVVSVGCEPSIDCEWLPGNGFGGFHFVQNITRTPNNDYAQTKRAWIVAMSQAIRSKDNKTPITIGFLSLGGFSQFEFDLDYLSIHVYPNYDDLQKAINLIENNQCSVPIIIEETSNLYCSITDLEEFLNSIDGQYEGLMGHYFGTPIEELDDSIIHALRRNFYQFFIDNNPN